MRAGKFTPEPAAERAEQVGGRGIPPLPGAERTVPWRTVKMGGTAEAGFVPNEAGFLLCHDVEGAGG